MAYGAGSEDRSAGQFQVDVCGRLPPTLNCIGRDGTATIPGTLGFSASLAYRLTLSGGITQRERDGRWCFGATSYGRLGSQ